MTGASSGIGAALVTKLARPGRRVFATMRKPSPELHGPDAIAMDVSNDASVKEAVAEIVSRTGRIDGIVNNAGVDLVGAVEETTSAEALSLFQTNFFGVHRLVREVLPIMRSQRSGRIITIGSIAGFLPEPYQAFYCAAKYALEGYVESLDYEVRPFGIRAMLVQPGFVRTSLGVKRTAAAEELEAYRLSRSHVQKQSSMSISSGTNAATVANAVDRLLTSRNPGLRTLVGVDARQLYILRHILPAPLFRSGLRRRLSH